MDQECIDLLHVILNVFFILPISLKNRYIGKHIYQLFIFYLNSSKKAERQDNKKLFTIYLYYHLAMIFDCAFFIGDFKYSLTFNFSKYFCIHYIF